ncbi:hypothetical protein NKR23_g10901 [Pleurostoma richardsiae]|uniref:Cerato-platanin n=1 Tax=Pleurostoma richardsiae TaxID=41990 RepID=A0AA38RIR4_9PEZI|nr:hypothetical protein NKR23_g10901 [Pleurostoma richardsiae]
MLFILLPILLAAVFVPFTTTERFAVPITPHDTYSSSVGVLGCKINTNRVAYWPSSVGCESLCVRVCYGGRSVTLLHVDTSGGAHDISYDAWNYLVTGFSAIERPVFGGAVSMSYEFVDMSSCADLFLDGRLPLSAANSVNYVSGCLEDAGSWVADHFILFNIYDPVCAYGVDEVCTLNWPQNNQPACPNSTLGVQTPLLNHTFYNIEYGTGRQVEAN